MLRDVYCFVQEREAVQCTYVFMYYSWKRGQLYRAGKQICCNIIKLTVGRDAGLGFTCHSERTVLCRHSLDIPIQYCTVARSAV